MASRSRGAWEPRASGPGAAETAAAGSVLLGGDQRLDFRERTRNVVDLLLGKAETAADLRQRDDPADGPQGRGIAVDRLRHQRVLPAGESERRDHVAHACTLHVAQ